METVLGERPAIDSSAVPGSRSLAIEARGLVKRFEGTLAVDGVDRLEAPITEPDLRDLLAGLER